MKIDWNFSDYPEKKNDLKVFSAFSGGGGSTMGYKLAGYDVVGCLELDLKMFDMYVKNHNSRFAFNCDIRDFVNKTDLPDELFDIDILDGSPPCTTFSMSGKREKTWGVEKKFNEGQKKQVLDTLFFDFIKLTDKLRPKVVISENVKGLLQGNAKGYVVEIIKEFEKIGYETQIFLLSAATMNVPQVRERVFFISKRKDLHFPKINLNFNYTPILFKDVADFDDNEEKITKLFSKYWDKAEPGGAIGKFKSNKKLSFEKIPYTLTATSHYFHPQIKRKLNKKEMLRIGTFPKDYKFNSESLKSIQYVIGMSVPPYMMYNLSREIAKQLFGVDVNES